MTSDAGDQIDVERFSTSPSICGQTLSRPSERNTSKGSVSSMAASLSNWRSPRGDQDAAVSSSVSSPWGGIDSDLTEEKKEVSHNGAASPSHPSPVRVKQQTATGRRGDGEEEKDLSRDSPSMSDSESNLCDSLAASPSELRRPFSLEPDDAHDSSPAASPFACESGEEEEEEEEEANHQSSLSPSSLGGYNRDYSVATDRDSLAGSDVGQLDNLQGDDAGQQSHSAQEISDTIEIMSSSDNLPRPDGLALETRRGSPQSQDVELTTSPVREVSVLQVFPASLSPTEKKEAVESVETGIIIREAGKDASLEEDRPVKEKVSPPVESGIHYNSGAMVVRVQSPRRSKRDLRGKQVQREVSRSHYNAWHRDKNVPLPLPQISCSSIQRALPVGPRDRSSGYANVNNNAVNNFVQVGGGGGEMVKLENVKSEWSFDTGTHFNRQNNMTKRESRVRKLHVLQEGGLAGQVNSWLMMTPREKNVHSKKKLPPLLKKETKSGSQGLRGEVKAKAGASRNKNASYLYPKPRQPGQLPQLPKACRFPLNTPATGFFATNAPQPLRPGTWYLSRRAIREDVG